MVLLPAIALAFFPPGVLFPSMANRMREGIVIKWQKFQKKVGDQVLSEVQFASSSDK